MSSARSWKLWKAAPEVKGPIELSRSQYSLVSCKELTPATLELWVGLPEQVKYDAALAPLRRMYEKEHGGKCSLFVLQELTPATLKLWVGLPEELKYDAALAPLRRTYEREHGESQTQKINGSTVPDPRLNSEVVNPRHEEGHLEDLETEVRPLNDAESIEMERRRKMEDDEWLQDPKIRSSVKKKETLWQRGQRYCKITFLLACWMFFTTILMLYTEKQLIERHSSLSMGELKTYQISTKANSLRLWVSLNGPFWSEPLQKKYKSNISELDSYMEVWLERTELVTEGNGTKGDSAISVERSQPWIVCLLENNLIDFTEGEPRATVLKINDNMDLYKQQEKVYNYSIKMKHNAKSTVPFAITYTKNPLDQKTGIIYAAILLIVLYVIIIFDIINRTLAAIITSTSALAVLALVGERPTMTEILSWMDSETLLLLFSMMVLVTLMAETGVFDYLAVVAFERTRGETWPLINLLYLLTIVVSLFLDNVTTVLLVTPATIRLCEVTNLNPVPILMGMVIFCNVGGTATPVGDPPNIIIATNPVVLHAGINFTNFTLHMSIGVFFVFIQTYLQFRFMYRDVNKLRLGEKLEVQQLRQQIQAWNRAISSLTDFTPEEKVLKSALKKKLSYLEQKVMDENGRKKIALPKASFEKTLRDLKEKYKIRDATLLVQTLVAITFIIIVFFLHSLPQLRSLSLGWSALLGTTMLLVLADKDDLQPVLSRLEWSTLLFFAALFIFMEAITKLGLIQWIGGLTEGLILQVDEQYQLPVAILLVLWVSGITSAFVDNIPLTSMMVRVVTSLGSNPNLALPMAPLIWALSFGACMGGNGTLVGASANVITAGVAEQYNYKITFREFFKIGAPMTVGHLTTVSIYLLISHCLFTWH